ncbi:MAG TPA: hypothetical protein VGG91_07505, partial [Myxococcaceae bacterium]
MRRIWQGALLSLLVLGAARADVLSDWTDTGIQLGVGAKQAAFMQTRTMAMVHVAVFDAVNGLERKYVPYTAIAQDKADRSAAPEAAAATAAHGVLVAIFPDQAASLDAALARSL